MNHGLAAYNKMLVALATAAAEAVALGLVSGTASKWVTVVFAFLGVFGVYAVPNQPQAGQGFDPSNPLAE